MKMSQRQDRRGRERRRGRIGLKGKEGHATLGVCTYEYFVLFARGLEYRTLRLETAAESAPKEGE